MQMTTVGAGVTFRETMSGGFALGETEPARGAQLGTQAGTLLVLHARLSIPSVRAFAEDAEHAGTLDGTVSFTPIGIELQTTAGFFKLFTATDDPNVKLMQYRMTFRRGTETYCLHGAKHVRRGSPLRGWSDTTTLACRLHRGADTSGAIVGAGILRINALSFAMQLLSFRTLNGRTIGAKARALTGFFVFFAGELLDTYVGMRS
jgi:hypothetical protein